ncbi:metal-independent alpha-mannosidase, partial [Pseudomonas sp. ODNR1LW]|nr:metal-independent alpha-mannosidase [Pseudomonas sp. ODNR1LW]
MIPTRRTLLATGAAFAAAPALAAAPAAPFISRRPAVSDRRFTSVAVEAEIQRVSARIADPKLRWMFANCYPNTLDTT